MNPTSEFYNSMQLAFDHFNEALFSGKLPQILFTNQRQKKVMGYFAPNRWATDDGKNCHEIAINPLYVGRATLIELMQTLVHEMVHCWQYCYGKPSIKSYHNKQWSDKMISIGLMPSTTGMPGGARVGQHMSDYPIADGKFIHGCETLLKDKKFKLPWVDRFSYAKQSIQLDETKLNNLATITNIEAVIANELTTKLEDVFGSEVFAPIDTATLKKVKSKYTCQNCRINVWGRPTLMLRCEKCDCSLIED